MDARARSCERERMAKQKPAADAKEAADTAATSQPSNKRKMLIIVGAIMLLEGGGIFAAMKLVGADPAAGSAEMLGVASQPSAQHAELIVVKLRAPNVKEGKLVLWSLTVVIRILKDDVEGLRQIIVQNENTIRDRFARIVRSAQPQYLQEDGLETLRRQLRHELNRVFEDESKALGAFLDNAARTAVLLGDLEYLAHVRKESRRAIEKGADAYCAQDFLSAIEASEAPKFFPIYQRAVADVVRGHQVWANPVLVLDGDFKLLSLEYVVNVDDRRTLERAIFDASEKAAVDAGFKPSVLLPHVGTELRSVPSAGLQAVA